jgi:phosphotriesterase-related protein
MRLLFFALMICLISSGCAKKEEKGIIMTVKGIIQAGKIGVTLTHEHILVDFIGADSVNESRWNKSDVTIKALPCLKEIKRLGCQTFVDCTPAYLGRDVEILRRLSDSSGLNIITNTGYYGAYNNKYIPEFAFAETADQLAERWITEWQNGIGGTDIKPGFIKIAVDRDSLSEFHRKLITAAAKAHLKTGLTIASHTGPAVPAFQQLEILKKEGVSPKAFIWVHAMNEKDSSKIIEAARQGAWISFDNLNDKRVESFVRNIKILRDNNLLNKILLSHDAGWFDPAKENGGTFRGYTTIFERLIPALKAEKFTEKEINQLLVDNPAIAFAVRIRKSE